MNKHRTKKEGYKKASEMSPADRLIERGYVLKGCPNCGRVIVKKYLIEITACGVKRCGYKSKWFGRRRLSFKDEVKLGL